MRYETDTLEIHENMRHSVAVLTYGGGAFTGGQSQSS